uniref:Uncharacterized protein n=1 Tax=Chromera velia CCMP2878 TaxID=1169474 RepID=A0A0G4I850_9ALVE|eukprot:Cvel_11858.t1-p1 / transcript=Cvel_11858.t1 / gene=Cvel_11858 / organism=Chromera_velia_CCMP2878 / gene_product=hypothetical protein / transcript_product=hypothetical protein / location=Cvel_scaffold756:36264-42512(-) / protein_length=1164 / sequence_SO=supercontig / SO=protein_coding / is_pseudo=false
MQTEGICEVEWLLLDVGRSLGKDRKDMEPHIEHLVVKNWLQTADALRSLSEEDWKDLGLPLFLKKNLMARLHSHVPFQRPEEKREAPEQRESPGLLPTPPASQRHVSDRTHPPNDVHRGKQRRGRQRDPDAGRGRKGLSRQENDHPPSSPRLPTPTTSKSLSPPPGFAPMIRPSPSQRAGDHQTRTANAPSTVSSLQQREETPDDLHLPDSRQETWPQNSQLRFIPKTEKVTDEGMLPSGEQKGFFQSSADWPVPPRPSDTQPTFVEGPPVTLFNTTALMEGGEADREYVRSSRIQEKQTKKKASGSRADRRGPSRSPISMRARQKPCVRSVSVQPRRLKGERGKEKEMNPSTVEAFSTAAASQKAAMALLMGFAPPDALLGSSKQQRRRRGRRGRRGRERGKKPDSERRQKVRGFGGKVADRDSFSFSSSSSSSASSVVSDGEQSEEDGSPVNTLARRLLANFAALSDEVSADREICRLGLSPFCRRLEAVLAGGGSARGVASALLAFLQTGAAGEGGIEGGRRECRDAGLETSGHSEQDKRKETEEEGEEEAKEREDCNRMVQEALLPVNVSVNERQAEEWTSLRALPPDVRPFTMSTAQMQSALERAELSFQKVLGGRVEVSQEGGEQGMGRELFLSANRQASSSKDALDYILLEWEPQPDEVKKKQVTAFMCIEALHVVLRLFHERDEQKRLADAWGEGAGGFSQGTGDRWGGSAEVAREGNESREFDMRKLSPDPPGGRLPLRRRDESDGDCERLIWDEPRSSSLSSSSGASSPCSSDEEEEGPEALPPPAEKETPGLLEGPEEKSERNVCAVCGAKNARRVAKQPGLQNKKFCSAECRKEATRAEGRRPRRERCQTIVRSAAVPAPHTASFVRRAEWGFPPVQLHQEQSMQTGGGLTEDLGLGVALPVTDTGGRDRLRAEASLSTSVPFPASVSQSETGQSEGDREDTSNRLAAPLKADTEKPGKPTVGKRCALCESANAILRHRFGDERFCSRECRSAWQKQTRRAKAGGNTRGRGMSPREASGPGQRRSGSGFSATSAVAGGKGRQPPVLASMGIAAGEFLAADASTRKGTNKTPGPSLPPGLPLLSSCPDGPVNVKVDTRQIPESRPKIGTSRWTCGVCGAPGARLHLRGCSNERFCSNECLKHRRFERLLEATR